jgi:hypothetical protein
MNYDANLDMFQKFMSKKEKEIETIDVSKWIECSLRHLQKWCKENKIEKCLSGGREYYVWDKISFDLLQRYLNKKKKGFENRTIYKYQTYGNYYQPRPKRVFPFHRINDFVHEVRLPKYIWCKWGDKKPLNSNYQISLGRERPLWVKARYVKAWCKENEIPFQWGSNKEKVYEITNEIKSQIIDFFNIPVDNKFPIFRIWQLYGPYRKLSEKLDFHYHPYFEGTDGVPWYDDEHLRQPMRDEIKYRHHISNLIDEAIREEDDFEKAFLLHARRGIIFRKLIRRFYRISYSILDDFITTNFPDDDRTIIVNSTLDVYDTVLKRKGIKRRLNDVNTKKLLQTPALIEEIQDYYIEELYKHIIKGFKESIT